MKRIREVKIDEVVIPKYKSTDLTWICAEESVRVRETVLLKFLVRTATVLMLRGISWTEKVEAETIRVADVVTTRGIS